MSPASKRPTDRPTINREHYSLKDDVPSLIAELRRLATKHTLDGMARYAIPSDKAFGVSLSDLHKLAKRLGRNHELAEALWDSGWYEARLLACFVEEPARVTAAQMDRWCRDFDSWAICDTACFHLFDRTPFAWKKARQWAKSPREFVKRSAFALMASLVAHDKAAPEVKFLELLPLIEEGANDDRNFVKKGVNWALRCIGKRSLPLNEAALKVSTRLAKSEEASCRWVGKDALRELSSPKLRTRLIKKGS